MFELDIGINRSSKKSAQGGMHLKKTHIFSYVADGIFNLGIFFDLYQFLSQPIEGLRVRMSLLRIQQQIHINVYLI